MIIKKLLKIISCLLIFSINIFPCYSMHLLNHSDCEINQKLGMLYDTGQKLNKEISEYLKKYNDVQDIMNKYKIGKKSVVFNDKIFENFDNLKELDKNIETAKNYISSFQNYDKEKLTTIKVKIINLLLNDEYVKKLSFTLILLKIKFGNISKCSNEQIKNLEIHITNLITKRMNWILLTNNSIYKEYSFILKTSMINKDLSEGLDSTEKFLNFKKDVDKKFKDNNCIDTIASEIDSFFNNKKSEYIEKFTSFDSSMNEFLDRILNSNIKSQVGFMYSIYYENLIKSNLKYLDNLINEYTLEIINKNIINKENWEKCYEKECKNLKYKINNIINKDKTVVNEIIGQIQKNNTNKLPLQKIYLDKESFSSIYNKGLPKVFADNEFIKFKQKSTSLYTFKCIDNLLKKFFINISDLNTHLKDHFNSKKEIESKVSTDSALNYSGKFNTDFSAFADTKNINDLFTTSIDNTIAIISTYQSEKETKKFTNHILYLYNYEKHGFIKTGEVYCKFDKKWHSSYAIVLVIDQNNNLITAHPRYIS